MVAESYINSAHPVPSSQIAQRLKVSSATVRNEFTALEEEGYLQQPHTSSGRIPTPLGFRVYTRALLPPDGLGPDEHSLVRQRLGGKHGDNLLESVAALAADLSGYAVVVCLPSDDSLHPLEIHLSAVSSRRVLAVVILENGLVRQLMVDLDPAPDDEVLTGAESSLRQLAVPLAEMPRAIADIAGREAHDLSRTLLALADAWPAMYPPRLFSGGLKQLLREPESRDPEFLRLVVEQVETPPEDELGDELELLLDEATARIRTRLDLGKAYASLMVVGPARMRYREALNVAHGIAGTLHPGNAAAEYAFNLTSGPN